MASQATVPARSSNRLWQAIKPKVNPAFQGAVFNQYSALHDQITKLRGLLGGDLMSQYAAHLDSILQETQVLRDKTQATMQSVKSYTKDGRIAFETIRAVLQAMNEKAVFLVEAFRNHPQELYLLQADFEFQTFKQDIRLNLTRATRSHFTQFLVVIVGIALAFVPYLNVISLIAGIHLVTQKDYRALAAGAICLGLFFIEALPMAFLAW